MKNSDTDKFKFVELKKSTISDSKKTPPLTVNGQ